MAPNNHIVVTLRLPRSELGRFDFSEHRSPFQKKSKKRPSSSPAPRTKTESKEPDDDKPASTPTGSTDPVLSSLPRSLKAAPVANTSGLSLDKTPCRKWDSQLVELKMISGYTINVRAWTSNFTDAEWQQKQIQQEAEEAQEPPESARTAAKTRKLMPKKAVKRTKDQTDPPSDANQDTVEPPKEEPTKSLNENQPELKIKLRKLAPLEPEAAASEDDYDESEASEPNSEAPSELMSEAYSEVL